MIIRVNLVDVLIFVDPIDTPWTNTTLYGVPGYPGDNNFILSNNFFIIVYSIASVGRNKSTILATESAGAFANAMNSMNLSISYDYAIAFMK